MFAEAGAWFWAHVVAAILIIWGDSNGTLEPALNKFEESIIIYYKEITGIGLVLRSLAERRDRFNGF